MKAGFAERDITPEPGMEKPGGYGKAYHDENVHDPCKIRASVFDDGKTRAALIGIDTLMVPQAFVQDVRARINQACGISPDAILIGASHSHSAGPLGMIQNEYDHASPLDALAAGDVPALILRQAFSPTACARLVDKMIERRRRVRDSVAERLGEA